MIHLVLSYFIIMLFITLHFKYLRTHESSAECYLLSSPLPHNLELFQYRFIRVGDKKLGKVIFKLRMS